MTDEELYDRAKQIAFAHKAGGFEYADAIVALAKRYADRGREQEALRADDEEVGCAVCDMTHVAGHVEFLSHGDLIHALEVALGSLELLAKEEYRYRLMVEGTIAIVRAALSTAPVKPKGEPK